MAQNITALSLIKKAIKLEETMRVRCHNIYISFDISTYIFRMWKILNNSYISLLKLADTKLIIIMIAKYLLSFYERDRNYYLLNTEKCFLAYEMKRRARNWKFLSKS